RCLARMSPAGPLFPPPSRSICSTNWRSCFCAEPCNFVMDLPPATYRAPQRRSCRQGTPLAGVSLAIPRRRRDASGAPSRLQGAAVGYPEVLARGFSQRFWPEDLPRLEAALTGEAGETLPWLFHTLA